MSKLPLVGRVLMGLVFFIFGLNGLFHFLPMPPIQGAAADFMNGMTATHYFLPLLAGTQVVCGALLLIGALVPLALIVLAPIILNIFLFHVFVDTSGLSLAFALGLIEIYLSFFAKSYSPIVKQIFRCPMKEAMQTKK